MLSHNTLNSIWRHSGLKHSPTVDCDFRIIQEKIFEKCHENIGINTLKRMFGTIKHNVKPRLSTLNIIARYIGYTDWPTYEAMSR